MAKSILVLLAKGFEEIEAVSIIDVCRRGGINVCTAGVEELLVLGANRITVAADCLLADVQNDDFDMVVLPGGLGGTNILATKEMVQNLLKKFKQNDKHIGAICAAPIALDKAGVLSDNFTCYPSCETNISKQGYNDTKKVIIDGKIITSRGPATAICFGLAIVEQLEGKEIAAMIQGGMLADFC